MKFKTPPNILAKNRRYRARNKERLSLYYRQRLGRCTPEQFKTAMVGQAGLCGICDQVMNPPCADHNHNTGTFRGLLCARCNRALGHFKDTVPLLEAAIRWLRGEHHVNSNSDEGVESRQN